MNRYTFILVAVLAFAPACWAGESENIGVVRAMIDAINKQDPASLDGVIRHSAATPGVVVTNID